MFGLIIKRYRRVFVALLLFIVITFLFAFVFPYFVLGYRSAYIISHVIPAVPRIFELGNYKVEMREVEISSEPLQRIDLYWPKGAEKTGFIIFFPGFNPHGSRDSRLVNLANAFAGAGIGVAVPDSANIKETKLSRKDIDLIKDTFNFLIAQDYADSRRIGLSGFSIAGSYILRAGAELGEDPVFAHALGAGYDLEELFAEIISEKAVYRESRAAFLKERQWQPDSLPKEVVTRVISEYMLEPQKTMLLSRKGPLEYQEARKFLQFLSGDFLREIEQISPAPVLKNIKTRVFLMHDKNDNLIPVEESRKMHDALSETSEVSYQEFSSFKHVTPANLPFREIFGLFRQVFTIISILYVRS